MMQPGDFGSVVNGRRLVLEIGRIYIGNYAYRGPVDLKGILQSYGVMRGVIYVMSVRRTLRLNVGVSEVPKNVV